MDGKSAGIIYHLKGRKINQRNQNMEKFIVKKSVCDKFREKVHNLIRELELEELKKESPNER